MQSYWSYCSPWHEQTKTRVPTGQEKLENVRENIIFEKSQKMILDYADYR